MFSQLHLGNFPEPHPSHQLEDVLSSELYLCAPTIGGYSLVSKSWGRFVVDQLKEVEWDSSAFGHLVLDPEKKDLIEAIVSAKKNSLVTDVISGKSGGFIVVLHGKPGTGKTLTAEAAAEHVQKPLLIVSASELANPGPSRDMGIEKLLRNAFDMAKTWDALVLIDEAEVYMESRKLGDVSRNAMVSILLRLLEYHQQAVFLTTNHLERFDTAFKSRIAVAIRYPDLTAEARETIWIRFLEKIDVRIVENSAMNGPRTIGRGDLRKLASKGLNGRYTPLSFYIKFLDKLKTRSGVSRLCHSTPRIRSPSR